MAERSRIRDGTAAIGMGEGHSGPRLVMIALLGGEHPHWASVLSPAGAAQPHSHLVSEQQNIEMKNGSFSGLSLFERPVCFDCCWKPCWPLVHAAVETTLMAMITAAARDRVDFCGPCCHQKSCGSP